MNIQIINLPLKNLKKRDSKQVTYKDIYICSEFIVKNMTEQLKDANKIKELFNKYRGYMPYHYIVSINGVVFQCKNIVYQHGLVYHKKQYANHALLICVDGYANKSMSSAQKTALKSLLKDLCAKNYSLPENIKFLNSLIPEIKIAGTSGDWNEIFNDLKQYFINKYPLLKITSTVPNSYSKDSSFLIFKFMSDTTYNTLDKIAKITGTPANILLQINQHLKQLKPPITSTTQKIPPNTVIYYKKTTKTLATVLQRSQKADAKFIMTWSQHIVQNVKNQTQKPQTNSQNIKTTKSMNTNQIDKFNQTFKPNKYQHAILEIYDYNNKKIQDIQFLISPSSFSEVRMNNYQLLKTSGGWFALKLGQQPININFNGYMLDTYNVREKHEFLSQYQKYIEDKLNNSLENINNYKSALIIEGRKYIGFIQSISFTKSGLQPFVYQYSIQFIALDDYAINNTEAITATYKSASNTKSSSKINSNSNTNNKSNTKSSSKINSNTNNKVVGNKLAKIITGSK